MKTQTITREQVLALAKTMPIEKLATWYEYGLFIQSHPTFVTAVETPTEGEHELAEEFAAWEAASDEDWLKIEQMIAEAT
jgi:hypothetical protein